MKAQVNTNGRSGELDNLTILRFAHAYESGGGVERHLADLNRALSERNRLTTIQIQLTTSADGLAENEERIGNSRVIRVPLLVQRKSMAAPNDGSRQGSLVKRMTHYSLGFLLYNWGLNSFVMRDFMGWRKMPRRPLRFSKFRVRR